MLLVLKAFRGAIVRAVARIGAMPRGRFLGAVIALTLVTRLALLPVVHPVYEADIKEYVEKAVCIARDGNPRASEIRADGSRFYRTLGYSLPLAGWYVATGVPETPAGRVRSAQVFNLLAAAAIVAMIVALGRAVGREAAGRAAAVVYATFLPSLMFCLLPYTETWTTLLVVSIAWCLAKLRQDGRLPAADAALGAALGLAEGLLLITRFEFAWLPFVAAAFVLGARHARGLLPAAASLLLLLVPLCVNHEMRDGYPGHLRMSVQGGLILFFGNNPIEVNGYGNATPAVVARKDELYRLDPTGGAARDEAIAWMKEHPFQAIGNAPKKLYHLWLAEPQGFSWHVGAGRDPGTNRVLAALLRHAAWVQALALLGLGAVAIARRAMPAPWLLVIALHAATWCLLASSTRNRYPLEPFLMIAAAAWLAEEDEP